MKKVWHMEVDEEYIQIKTLAGKIAETVLDAYSARFRRFDLYEKSVIFSSLLKVMTTFLENLNPKDRIFAIKTILSVVEKLLVFDDQNEKL